MHQDLPVPESRLMRAFQLTVVDSGVLTLSLLILELEVLQLLDLSPGKVK